MINKLRKEKYLLFVIATLNFILSPISIALTQVSAGIMVGTNYSILILSGLLLAIRKIPKILSVVFGLSTLVFIWFEFYYPESNFSEMRMLSSFIFFSILMYILGRNILTSPTIDLKIALGTVAGYILLGILGGLMFELLESRMPGSLSMNNYFTGYVFYYYSFISLSTIGFGDIVPLTPLSQALTILMSIVGQFYMVIGVGLFVGKLLSKS